MDDKKQEELYGKPDSTFATVNTVRCDHFFIRKNATDIGCANCHNGWINLAPYVVVEGGKLTLNPNL